MITTKKVSIKDLYVDVSGMEMLPVTVLGDYRKNGASGVVDVGCFSTEQMNAITDMGIPVVNSMVDSWKQPLTGNAPVPNGRACSCCMKKMEDGTVIMGRNMDLPITFAPVVVFRTKGDGKTTYDTVNIAYNAPGNISFDQVAEIGAIPQNFFVVMALSVCDAFNSQGLYLQYDMRECADCPNSGTNANGSRRVASFNLIRLLADHCATIDEALQYLNDLDIYDPKSPTFDWSMAIGMMDKTGKYGVVEFVNNKVIWNEGRTGFACGHCNFYWAKEAATSRFGSGVGRWRKLMEYYYDINSQDDMERAMKNVRYSNLFTDGALVRDWKVDWFTEVNDKIPYFVANRLNMIYEWRDTYGIKVDETHLAKVLEIAEKEKKQGGKVWTAEYLHTPENFYDIITTMDLFIKCFAQLPLEAQKLSGFMEITSIGYTANNKELGYVDHFFETNDVYHIGLHETTIDRIPTEKKFGNA